MRCRFVFFLAALLAASWLCAASVLPLAEPVAGDVTLGAAAPYTPYRTKPRTAPRYSPQQRFQDRLREQRQQNYQDIRKGTPYPRTDAPKPPEPPAPLKDDQPK